ncbi:MAG: hypothetical protein IJP20_05530 [Clostridia bacterium]|nr:hypothetical protein [Clostridia bacterium]
MKISKIALILSVLTVFLLLATSCSFKPTDSEWFLQGYKMSYTFIGGIERTVNFAEPSVEFPFTDTSSETTNIRFHGNNGVTIMTYEGETLTGTYEEIEGGAFYSAFLVTLTTGEIFQIDISKILGVGMLNFTFRDVIYYYTDENQRTPATVDSVIYEIRNKENIAAKKCSISITEEGYKLEFEESTVSIDKDTAVFVAHIDENDNFNKLDAVKEGECLACYVEDADYLVIYYVDPKN